MNDKVKTTRLEDGFVVMSDENMTGCKLFASSEVAIIHMTIHPGGAVTPHSAAVNMEFFVIAGQGRFSVGDDEVLAEPGTLVESPANVPHGIVNVGKEPLVLLAVKNRPQ
jgi:mannose-6-phosphate isomerase-like protein (cupin superfamily)